MRLFRVCLHLLCAVVLLFGTSSLYMRLFCLSGASPCTVRLFCLLMRLRSRFACFASWCVFAYSVRLFCLVGGFAYYMSYTQSFCLLVRLCLLCAQLFCFVVRLRSSRACCAYWHVFTVLTVRLCCLLASSLILYTICNMYV